MKIVVGSYNKTKINAVKEIFQQAEVTAISASSGVSAQPTGDEETRLGAINRAKEALSRHPKGIGIGLEGGVMFLCNKLYLCNWGAMITSDRKLYTASGARIQLPQEFTTKIDQDFELSEIMSEYTNKQGIRYHEGAIGIFTNGEVLRQEMFSHVVSLLKGQMEYWNK